MPMLIDFDPFGDWPNDLGAETPTKALVAAPAYCLITDGDACNRQIPQQLTESEAGALIQCLKNCRTVIFGMEVPAGRVAPFYVAAFATFGNTVHLMHYYTFERKPNLAYDASVIFRLAEHILRDKTSVHSCYVPVSLRPPTHIEVDVDGHESEVLSSPALSHKFTDSGVELFLGPVKL